MISKISRCPELICFGTFLDFVVFLKYLGVSKVRNKWFGESWTRPKIQNHENAGCSCFPKVKSNSYQSKLSQHTSAQLLGYSNLKLRVKLGPQTSRRSQIRIFPISLMLINVSGHIAIFFFDCFGTFPKSTKHRSNIRPFHCFHVEILQTYKKNPNHL